MARPCRDTTCDTTVIIRRRAFTNGYMAFEADDVTPFSIEATGAYVLFVDHAYRPGELIEDLQARWEISEDKAREHVAGHPWHRPHMHEIDPVTGDTPHPSSTTPLKETTSP